jgi:radical SAM protein with 4Fe4S-binding SPASM domain
MSLQDMQEHFMDYPIEVSIETQALCNAACTFCPYPTIDRKGVKMPDEVLNRLVDEMISWDRGVYFSPFKLSEPLLDKRVIPLCERINRESEKIVLRIFSNGSALTPVNIAKLAGLKRLSYVWVSLNEYRPEEYEKLMGLSFERVAKNLDYLHSVEDFPHKVMLSCVGFPNEEFRRYCFDRWHKFDSMAIKKDAWLGFTDAQFPDIPDTGCSRWFELSITSTGKVVTCCMDAGDNPAYHIGDVNTQTLHEVYNAPRWRDRREALVSRKALDDSSPCSRCSY